MDRLNGASFFGAKGWLCRVRSHRRICSINAFMRTAWFVVLVALLTAASSLFSLELPVYTLFIAIAVYLCLFGEDFLPLMPVAVCCYIAPSPGNNPGRNESSIFYPENGGIYLLVLAALFAACLILRLVTDPDFGGMRFLKTKRVLAPGMIALGTTYLLSGLGMEGYFDVAGSNLLFAVIQFAAVFGMYFLFTGAVKWEKAPKAYLAWTAMAVGFVVLAQLLENYVSGRIFMENTSTIDRELINTGWGMHNNIGVMMALCMPFAFYLAGRQRHGWVFAILGTVLLLGVIASCSRTSMIMAILAFGACIVILLRRSGDKKLFLKVFGLAAVAVAIGVVLMWDRLMDVFQLFLDELLIISSRDKIYVNGFKQFLQYPIFGGSFYPQTEYVPWDWADLEAFSSFFPPRWHNTWIQIGASCGAVGLAAYAFHRIQTARLLLRERSPEKLFIAISLTVLLAASLLDCHFFNVGPVLFYSMALAFAENIGKSAVE